MKRLLAFLLIGSSLSGMDPGYRAYLNRRHAMALTVNKGVLSDMYNTLSQGWFDLKDTILEISDDFYQQFLPNHAYRDFFAKVRFTENDELCAAEIATVKMRKFVVQSALERMLDKRIDENYVPTIAFCGSGGGFRAMVLSLGFLQGAQDIGLLNSLTYMAGLSGSTWAMAPWIASGHELSVYSHRMKQKIKDGIDHLTNPSELSKLISRLLEKVLYGQNISAMDIYGALLANTLLFDLGEKRIEATLSETHCGVDMGAYPFPIYTTIATNSQPYEWFEVTPFEIGSSYLKAYIPIWAYGRKFDKGLSTNSPREQSLGYFMGVFGSAFEVDLEDVVRITADQLISIGSYLPDSVSRSLETLIHLLAYDLLDEVRLFPSVLANFTYTFNKPCPWTEEKELSLVDAGIDFNLPLPPLLRPERHVDCIIIYDSSADASPGDQLRKAQDYAWRKGLAFPPVDYTDIDKKIVSVFKDDSNLDCPVIVYFPLIKNPEYSDTFDPRACIESGYCSTFNFEYGEQEVDELSGLSRFAVTQQQAVIKEVIEDIIGAKKKTVNKRG